MIFVPAGNFLALFYSHAHTVSCKEMQPSKKPAPTFQICAQAKLWNKFSQLYLVYHAVLHLKSLFSFSRQIFNGNLIILAYFIFLFHVKHAAWFNAHLTSAPLPGIPNKNGVTFFCRAADTTRPQHCGSHTAESISLRIYHCTASCRYVPYTRTLHP